MVEPLFTRAFGLLNAAHLLQALAYSSLVLLPVWLDFLGATRAQVGVVMSASALGGLLARPLVAWALDRVGRKATLYVGTVVVGGGMVALLTVDAVGPWVTLLHAIIGIGEGALFTGYFTFAADIVPERRRTEGLALFGISGLVPLVVTPFAGGLGIEGAALRGFFPTVGLLVLASIAFLVPLPEATRPVGVVSPGPRAVARALRHRGLWPVWVATLVFAGLVAVYMAFATVIAANRGVANPGVIWLTYAFGAVTVRLAGASLPDRVGPSRMVPPALAAYCGAIGVAAFAGSGLGFALSGLLAGIGHGYCFPVLSSQTVSRTSPDLRGSAMALFTGLWDLAKLVLVPAAGLLADLASDRDMMLVCTVSAVAGLVLWAVLERSVETGELAR
ncbi:MAG: MFS transporter [Myxococcota bacterium]